MNSRDLLDPANLLVNVPQNMETQFEGQVSQWVVFLGSLLQSVHSTKETARFRWQMRKTASIISGILQLITIRGVSSYYQGSISDLLHLKETRL